MQLFIAEICIFILISIAVLYVDLTFLTTFFSSKLSAENRIKLPIYCFYVFVKTLQYIFLQAAIINLVVTLVIIGVLTLMYKTKIASKVMALLINLIFSMLIEVVVVYAYSVIYMADVDDILVLTVDRIIINTVLIVVSLIFVKIYQKVVKHKNSKINTNYNFFEIFKLIIIPSCSILLINIYHLNFSDIGNPYFVIISCILILFINLVFYVLYENLAATSEIKIENTILKQQQEKYIDEHNKTVNHYIEIKTIKHNLKNRLILLKSKIDNDSNDSNDELILELDNILGTQLDFEIPNYTDNLAINYLLSYKNSNAKEKNIIMQIQSDNLGELSIQNEANLCVILGNLLDNTIESFDDGIANIDKISLNINKENKNIFIKISNPYNHNLLYENQKLISSKNSQESGFGLKSITKTVENIGGHITINTENNIFTVRILLLNITE
ncbi:MAG: GHKL domain-containing protein [Clostridia bacterium]